jgi:K+-transporting ATPase ATPase C chain
VENAEYQLDRVASKWAGDLKRDPAQVRGEIEKIIQADAYAPMRGLFGEKMVNVLQLNLDLRRRFGPVQG